ncbi:hypothetical protein CEE45_07030 [Candidatus Heimdallarchaeota archaeon B3_Heim]|nr:MAG: hypothetical protein CEE45_07030 [Candidatus Heimdallarchaeota archaeon B3_Heim]
MEKEKRYFFMCPPFEIVGRKKQLVVGRRGHFEISQNLVQYKLANSITDFLVLHPSEGLGVFTKLPPESNLDSFQLFRQICGGRTEINFLPSDSDQKLTKTALDFIYGNMLPFIDNEMGPGFYNLHPLHPNVYEEFYKLAEQQEDSITTTVATFDKNVFVPFKQKVIGAYHTDGEAEEEKSKAALDIINRDFPRFLNLHQDLQTILFDQAKLITEYQSISFSIISPLLRKFRMLSLLQSSLITEKKKKGTEIRFEPKTCTINEVVKLITPSVAPR